MSTNKAATDYSTYKWEELPLSIQDWLSDDNDGDYENMFFDGADCD